MFADHKNDEAKKSEHGQIEDLEIELLNVAT